MRIPDYGVEVIEGLPGSGKSYAAVEKMLRVVLSQKRPCYTNLPLNFSKVRAYLRLKGGEKCANLIQELKQEHFRKFIARFVKKAKCRELATTLKTHTDLSVVDANFDRDNGPDVAIGEHANWVPATSLVILDEVHWWFPMRDQASEPRELLEYLSMHRHVWHWLWVLTQDRGRISISFRKMATKFTTARNISEDRLAWGLRFKHLGISGLGYATYTGDQVENRTLDSDPLENHVVFPWLPWNRFVFRLYRSFTHLGTADELQAVLARERVVAGVDVLSGDKPVSIAKGGASKLLKFAVVGMLVVCLLVFVVVGFALVSGGRSSTASPGVATTVAPPVFPRFDGIVDGAAVFDGKRVKPAEMHKNIFLVEADVAAKTVLIDVDGYAYLWLHGAPPRLLGDSRLVARAIRGGRSVPPPAVNPSQSETVQAPESGR